MVQPLEDFIAELAVSLPHRVAWTAVFATRLHTGTPQLIHHHLNHNQVLHEQVIMLTVLTEEIPRVPASERVVELGQQVEI